MSCRCHWQGSAKHGAASSWEGSQCLGEASAVPPSDVRLGRAKFPLGSELRKVLSISRRNE